VLVRNNNAINSRVKLAEFSQKKLLEDLDIKHLPSKLVENLESLKTLKFIEEATNLILIVSPGTGKTHVSIGLGMLDCQK